MLYSKMVFTLINLYLLVKETVMLFHTGRQY